MSRIGKKDLELHEISPGHYQAEDGSEIRFGCPKTDDKIVKIGGITLVNPTGIREKSARTKTRKPVAAHDDRTPSPQLAPSQTSSSSSSMRAAIDLLAARGKPVHLNGELVRQGRHPKKVTVISHIAASDAKQLLNDALEEIRNDYPPSLIGASDTFDYKGGVFKLTPTEIKCIDFPGVENPTDYEMSRG